MMVPLNIHRFMTNKYGQYDMNDLIQFLLLREEERLKKDLDVEIVDQFNNKSGD